MDFRSGFLNQSADIIKNTAMSVLLLFLSVSAYGFPGISDLKGLYRISDQIIAVLGKNTAYALDKANIVLPENDPYNVRLRSLSKLHLNEDELKIDIKVYDKKDINAFALPNGSIRFYTGLMDILDDGELRFVLGHEIGHIKKQHALKKLVLAFGINRVKAWAGDIDQLENIADSELSEKAQKLVNSQFSQIEELQADRYAYDFLLRHQYKLGAALTVFDKLQTAEQDTSLFSSHPSSDKRKKKMQVLLEKNK